MPVHCQLLSLHKIDSTGGRLATTNTLSKPIILLHEFRGSCQEWQNYIQVLKKASPRTIRVMVST